MYVMEIGGVGIVLGTQWLETSGIVGLNLQEQFIRFYENGRKYKLYSINYLPPQIVSSNKMEKIIKKGAQAFFLNCYVMERTTDERQNTDPRELEQLLDEHSDNFQKIPHGLPPPCSRDHIIKLMPWSAPIKKKS